MGLIDKATVDKIFDSADILDVVSSFVNLKRRGANYLGNCPFHNEKTPSFTVSPSKGIYKCFGCGKGGNAVNFIMEHEQLSYVETLRYLAKRYNIEIVEKELTQEEKQQESDRDSMLIVSNFAQKTFVDNLHNTEEGKAVGLSYFTERGFTEKTIEKFELGYCRKQSNSFSQTAVSQGYNKRFLVKTGLSIECDNGDLFDRFSERVMFPIHNLMGKVIGFGGRTLRTDKKMAKYLNSPESEIYHKSKVLYGLYFAKKAISQQDKCYLVEGYTDVISMHQSGVENVVASSGTALTPDQIRLIKRFSSNITVLFDGDAAGIKAALRGIDLILEEGMNVKVMLLPDGEDPDSFAKSHSAAEFTEFITQNETDFIKFKTNLLLADTNNDPVKKANLISDIVSTIAVIPNGIKRSVYIKECADMLQIEEKVLYSEINNKLRKKQEAKYYAQQREKNRQANLSQYEQPDITQEATKPIEKQDKFAPLEREIIRLLLMYGERDLFIIEAGGEATTITTGRYIINEVQSEFELRNSIYKTIFEEYAERLEEDNKVAPDYFSKHHNYLVSQTAADLLSDKHFLSKIWTRQGSYINEEADNLKAIIDKTINAYKYEEIIEMLKKVRQEMKEIQNNEEQAEQIEFLCNQNILYNQYKKEIAKILGERIILKY